MANHTSSIDDLLMASVGNTQQPQTPENVEAAEQEIAKKAIDVPRETAQKTLEETLEETASAEPNEAEQEEETDEETQEEIRAEKPNTDEYGNEMPKPRTYTQEEADEYANRIVRERLARLERKNPGLTQSQQQQAQQAVKQGFEYDENSPQDWQQQLEAFVEQTVARREQKQAQQIQQMREEQAEAEFSARFQNGMRKFPDYVETVQSQPITDAMVMASRSMKDPAAFFYAASKRAPAELQEIARDPDPISQIARIAKLEEKLKSTPMTQSKAPKPIAKPQEDVADKPKTKKREPTIEDLIAQEDAKRKALLIQKRRGGF